MRSKKVTFKNSEDQQLSGRLDFPIAGKPVAFVLFAHCFTCSKNLKTLDNISQAMTQSGFAVLRFDFTGLGMSEGDFSESNFSSNVQDLVLAYKFLESEYMAPQIVIGHSLGGAAVLHASDQFPSAKAVVTIGAPSSPDHVLKLIKDSEELIKENGEAEVDIGGRPFKIKQQFIEDIKKRSSGEVIAGLDKALLILHSPQDMVVGIQNAAEIYDQAMHPKSFITLDGADHLMSDPADSTYVGSIICPWASRYIDKQIKNEIAPEGEVWVKTGKEGFFTEIIAGEHHMIADEPKESGGTDLGASPYGYLLSALGTCTAMTLRMYADHKKINLDQVQVKLTHDKIHNEDGENTDNPKGKIDRIKRSILMEGDLTPEQRKRLIEIADRCPVHKTLEGRPQIETEEAS